MTIRLILAATILLASTSLSYAAAGKKQSAPDLVKNAREGVALVGQGLKESKTDTKSKAVAPFLKTLKSLDESLKTASEQISKKDKSANKTISQAASTARTLEVTFSRSGIKDPKVKQGVAAVNDSVLVLTKSVLGGGLAKSSKKDKAGLEKSKSEYAKLQEKQKEMDKQISVFKAKLKADPKADPALVKTIARMERESKLVSSTPFSADALIDALLLIADLAGLFDGWSYYVSPSYASYWTSMNSLTDYSKGWLGDVWTVLPYDEVYYTDIYDVPDYYYDVAMPDAQFADYETYLDTTYDSVDLSGKGQDPGYYADVAVSTEDISYLEDEQIDETLQEEETIETAEEDTDHDGTADAEDNDDDNDGTPDASDTDDDNDGVPDTDDTDEDEDSSDAQGDDEGADASDEGEDASGGDDEGGDDAGDAGDADDDGGADAGGDD
jgi:hypothetical protein